MAAAIFHGSGYEQVADLSDAYHLLSPLLGTTVASLLFAMALLLSGQNATLTGTLAGQIVMEGFLTIRLRPWLRRIITRLVAIVPALVVIAVSGDQGAGRLLVFSQVLLSLQLPFAVFPLVVFCGNRQLMGSLAAPRWMLAIAWPTAIVIAALNAWLLVQSLRGL
jgi:manganese transport protein